MVAGVHFNEGLARLHAVSRDWVELPSLYLIYSLDITRRDVVRLTYYDTPVY